jgi:elongation factor G
MAGESVSLVEVPLGPAHPDDQDALRIVLMRLAAENGSFNVVTDSRTGGIVLGGPSERDLDAFIDNLKREFSRKIDLGSPQVAYREAITRPVAIVYTHKKLAGNVGEFAKVNLRFEPASRGAGHSFEVRTSNVPEQYVGSIEMGISAALTRGVRADCPVVDVRSTLLNGAYHEFDSSAFAFEAAAKAATSEALRKGCSVLLEPIMAVEVVTPEEFTGSVIGDLKSRRGEIQHVSIDRTVVNASVPLGNMFGYINQLRAFSAGRAVFTMRFERYEQVPWGDHDPPFRPAIGMRA